MGRRRKARQACQPFAQTRGATNQEEPGGVVKEWKIAPGGGGKIARTENMRYLRGSVPAAERRKQAGKKRINERTSSLNEQK